MIPELFTIPSITFGPITIPEIIIHSFGVMAMLGFFIPTLLLRKEFARFKHDPDLANGIIIATMFGGFVGARIYFIAERWSDFFADSANQLAFYAMIITLIIVFGFYTGLRKQKMEPIPALSRALGMALGVFILILIAYIAFYEERTWSQYANSPANLVVTGAGLVWYGGLIGAILSVFLYVRDKKISFPFVFDLMAPLNALGQTFGRIGCLLSGDGDYGPPTDLPWAMSFPKGIIPTNELVHPTPIYDMIWLFGSFIFLWSIRKKELPTGFKMALYLILVGTGRILTELFRTTPKVLLGLTAAQIISIAFITIGGIILFNIASKGKAKNSSEPKPKNVKAS